MFKEKKDNDYFLKLKNLHLQVMCNLKFASTVSDNVGFAGLVRLEVLKVLIVLRVDSPVVLQIWQRLTAFSRLSAI